MFADAKEKHSMRFTYYRGLARVSKWVRLKFVAMNLKKFAIHRWDRSENRFVLMLFTKFDYIYY